jgi:hypothetical protein
MDQFWQVILIVYTSLGGVMAAVFLIPGLQQWLGAQLSRLVAHHFDQRIEEVKSSLRQTEQRLEAELRSAEQTTRVLGETALRMQSNRHEALNARRLVAVEALWKAKTDIDKMIMAPKLLAGINVEVFLNAADKGEHGIQETAEAMLQLMNIDMLKSLPNTSPQAQRPFLAPDVWALFSAYSSVIIEPVLVITAVAHGATKFLKREDTLKPMLLLILPEHSELIKLCGKAGYDPLIAPLEQKLLTAIGNMLEGRDADAAMLQRSAEVMAAINKHNAATAAGSAEAAGKAIASAVPTA